MTINLPVNDDIVAIIAVNPNQEGRARIVLPPLAVQFVPQQSWFPPPAPRQGEEVVRPGACPIEELIYERDVQPPIAVKDAVPRVGLGGEVPQEDVPHQGLVQGLWGGFPGAAGWRDRKPPFLLPSSSRSQS